MDNINKDYDIMQDTQVLENDIKVFEDRLKWMEYTINKISWELWRRKNDISKSPASDSHPHYADTQTDPEIVK